MRRENYEKWTKEFMESWKELDWERTLKTLDKEVKYYFVFFQNSAFYTEISSHFSALVR